jgi:hypothetical protein
MRAPVAAQKPSYFAVIVFILGRLFHEKYFFRFFGAGSVGQKADDRRPIRARAQLTICA